MTTPTDRWQRIAAWFDEIVDLAPAERAARLAAIANEDATAAAEVRALLDADASADGLLERDAASAIPTLIMNADAAPDDGRVGPYRLLMSIGEGGMGTVFLAERSDGSYGRARRGQAHQARHGFGRDRAPVPARAAHPRAARTHEYRAPARRRHQRRRPPVLRDGVRRRPPDHRTPAAYKLGVRERVALVAKVAEAVAYAHAQLVVHRDLKPSNVLVDTQNAPHVLDFGIAKLLEESGDAALTSTGMRVLSPAYAAPEQCSASRSARPRMSTRSASCSASCSSASCRAGAAARRRSSLRRKSSMKPPSARARSRRSSRARARPRFMATARIRSRFHASSRAISIS